MFFLALTFGLEDDPVAAVERMVGFVEETGRKHGVEHPIQMTIATTDGTSIWAFRYSSERRLAVALLQHAHGRAEGALPGERGARAELSERRGSSSEPSVTSRGPGTRCPSPHAGVVQPGTDVLGPFTPRR